MAVRLKNITGAPLVLGVPGGPLKMAGEIIKVEGSVSADSPNDAYVIGEGDAARAYPKSQWKLMGGKDSPDDTADVPAPPVTEEKS